MKTKLTFIIGLVAVVVLALAVGLTRAQGPQPPGDVGTQALMGTAFTYQGQLKKGGNPLNGTCDFQFSLWDAASGGSQIGSTQTKTNVNVSNGLFTISNLDFGAGAFNGDARWLQIAVKCTGDADYTTLSPRQPLTAAPHALYTLNADTLDGQHASAFASAALLGSSYVYEGSNTQQQLFGMSATGWAVLTDGDLDLDHTLIITTTNVRMEYTLWYGGTVGHGEASQGSPATITFPHYQGFQPILARHWYIASLVCNENDGVVACVYQKSHP